MGLEGRGCLLESTFCGEVVFSPDYDRGVLFCAVFCSQSDGTNIDFVAQGKSEFHQCKISKQGNDKKQTKPNPTHLKQTSRKEGSRESARPEKELKPCVPPSSPTP